MNGGGCARVVDLTGKVFNRLRVLRKCGTLRQNLWLCQCECGKQRTATANQLIKGYVKSCGCLRKDTLRENHRNNANVGHYKGTNIALLMLEPPCHNVSGCTGVSYVKALGKWKASIQCQGKSHWLGVFNTFEEAVKARKEGEYKYQLPLIEEYHSSCYKE